MHMPKRDPKKDEDKEDTSSKKRERSPESPNARLARKRREVRSTSPFRHPDSSDSDGNTYWDTLKKKRFEAESVQKEAELKRREEAERKRKEWPRRQDPPIHNVNDIPASWCWHPNDDDINPRLVEVSKVVGSGISRLTFFI